MGERVAGGRVRGWFTVPMRAQKRKDALHEPPLSGPSATLSPPCGERAGRGVPIKFMVPMHTRKRKGAFHEPWGDGAGDARSANRSGTRSLRMARRTVLPFILSCPRLCWRPLTCLRRVPRCEIAFRSAQAALDGTRLHDVDRRRESSHSSALCRTMLL